MYAYADRISAYVAEEGFATVDAVALARTGTDDEWAATAAGARAKFLEEHTHDDDEVRFFVEGQGLFCLHIDDKVYQVLCTRNDLISVPANATAQDIEKARQRIDEIHSRLDAGEDFGRLAVATSHAQTALEGGSLGWRKGAQLPTLFRDAVIKMKAGEYSQPIQASSGFQIVKLNEMRGAERTMVDQMLVRHILVRPNEILDDAAARQKLLGVRAQILGGALPQLERLHDFAPALGDRGRPAQVQPAARLEPRALRP